MIIRTLGEHANHFTTMAPLCIRRYIGLAFKLAFGAKIIIHLDIDRSVFLGCCDSLL